MGFEADATLTAESAMRLERYWWGWLVTTLVMVLMTGGALFGANYDDFELSLGVVVGVAQLLLLCLATIGVALRTLWGRYLGMFVWVWMVLLLIADGIIDGNFYLPGALVATAIGGTFFWILKGSKELFGPNCLSLANIREARRNAT